MNPRASGPGSPHERSRLGLPWLCSGPGAVGRRWLASTSPFPPGARSFPGEQPQPPRDRPTAASGCDSAHTS